MHASGLLVTPTAYAMACVLSVRAGSVEFMFASSHAVALATGATDEL